MTHGPVVYFPKLNTAVQLTTLVTLITGIANVVDELHRLQLTIESCSIKHCLE